VAAALATERNDITVVDTDHQRLRELAEKLDIRTVVGHASLPSVLAQAGAEEAGMLVAVTSSDEVNLIACQVAEKQFGTHTRSRACAKPNTSILPARSPPRSAPSNSSAGTSSA
jgi:trk system potassium uptake protein TrkA